MKIIYVFKIPDGIAFMLSDVGNLQSNANNTNSAASNPPLVNFTQPANYNLINTP
jgi:hypothetical protein